MGFSYSSKLGDGTGIGDDGFSYNPVTDTLDVGTLTANNVVVTALATPTVTSVTPTLTQVGTINVVAGASLVDGDYFTVDYGSGTILIEFDLSPGNGTTGGRVPYVYAAGDTADAIRDGLITLLNSAAGTALTASSGGAATVSLSLDTPGAPGDMNTENVANAGFTVAGFADPTAATTYGYKVVSYLADGTSTAASTEVTTAAGHATLSASNYNTVVFAPSAGSTSTRLYRVRDGTGVLATPRLLYTGTATSYVDVGAAGTAQTPATVNTTGTLTGKFLDGTVTAPSIGIASIPGGFYKSSFSRTVYTNGTAGTVAFGDYLTLGQLGRLVWVDNNDPGIGTVDTILSRAAAATLQLGAANANADGVDQTLTTQGGITGTDRAAGDLTIQTGVGTGAGISNVQIRTPVSLATGTTAQVQSTKVFHSSAQKVLTLGSATTFAAVTFPAASTCTIAIDYSINIVDSNGERKSNGGRYYFSAYRKATGNGVAGTVVETGDAGVASVGGAMTDAMTVTGTATGVTIAQNAAAGTGMAANPTGTINWSITAHGNGAIAVTPQ